MGIQTVAVYSEADAHARHVAECDEARAIGPAAAQDSYLRIERIVAAARDAGAQAAHPGYGFLSENPAFAEACAQAGLIFIGPPAAAMRAMGSKSAAKALMEQAGVPLVPGYHGDNQEPEFLRAQAAAIGYPVLIKASFGDGQLQLEKISAARAAYRNSSVCRYARQCGPFVRARLFGAAPPSESARRSAGARHDGGVAAGHGRGGVGRC